MPDIQKRDGRTFITLPVSYAELDRAKALTLREIRSQFCVKGPTGQRISLDSLRRWASPKKGCHPIGPSGPVVILPLLKVGGGLLAMPQWVSWFFEQVDRIRDANHLKAKFNTESNNKKRK